MTTIPEAASGLFFLIAQLRAGTTSPGGVRIGSAELGKPFPCVIVAFQSGFDVYYSNAVRAFIDALYQCKAVGSSENPDAVVALAGQIEDALGGDQGLQHIDVTGGHVLSCNRQAPLLYEDVDKAGTKYMHVGGIWRIQNQQKPS